jgi:putrescine transport system ATP-binding protein
VMDEGRVMQVATPDRIYENPASVYVADFIGDVNLIEGKVSLVEGDLCRIDWAEGQPPVLARSTRPIPDGTSVHFAIRPEKITISADRPADADNAVKGKVLDIAYLGNVSTYHVRLPSGHVMKAQTANNRRIGRRSFTWEDEVWLSWTDTAGVVLTE